MNLLSLDSIHLFFHFNRMFDGKFSIFFFDNRNPTATILPTADIPRHKPAPIVAYFSSRGPSVLTENILKVFFFHIKS